MMAAAAEWPLVGRARGPRGRPVGPVSWAPLARLLGTVSLTAADWGLVTLCILCPVLLLEALKAARARIGRR
jgi:hypothetical protein